MRYLFKLLTGCKAGSNGGFLTEHPSNGIASGSANGPIRNTALSGKPREQPQRIHVEAVSRLVQGEGHPVMIEHRLWQRRRVSRWLAEQVSRSWYRLQRRGQIDNCRRLSARLETRSTSSGRPLRRRAALTQHSSDQPRAVSTASRRTHVQSYVRNIARATVRRPLHPALTAHWNTPVSPTIAAHVRSLP